MRNFKQPAAGLINQIRSPRGLVVVAAALAAAALVVAHKTRQVEREHAPTGKFLEVDGVRLHYLERGHGPALVLLHGNGITSEDFVLSGLFDLASANHRVIAFDRPGYGYSERPRGGAMWTPAAQAALLHRAFRQLGIERPIVLGHSWGTLVALALGLDFPDDIQGLVLLSGYYYPTPRLDVVLAATPALPVLGDLMRYTVSPLLGRLLWPALVKRLFQPSRVTQQFATYPAWMSLRPTQLRASAAESGLMVPAAGLLSRHYQELKLPVAILAGEDDRIVDTWHQSVRLHEELPGSNLQLLPGIGHMLHHMAPRQVMVSINALAQGQGIATSPLRQGEPALAHVFH